jgi:TonB family protein
MRRILTSVLGLALSTFTLPLWPQQPAQPSVTQPPATIHVSAGVMAGNRVGGNAPAYPAIAKAAHVEGTVVLAAEISRDGAVQDLRVISGPPMLQAAAIDAIRTWTYKPYLLNGEPVAVHTQINVVFNLGGSPPAGFVAATGAAPPPGEAPVVHTVQVKVNPPLQPTDLSPGGPPPPAHPITTEQVHELMVLTGAVNLTKQMLDTMMPTLRQTMPPYMPPDVLDDFESTLVGSDFEGMLVHTYQAHLSTEDAAQIIAFYKTPAGQRMLAAMPHIAKESQLAGQQLGEQVMMQVLERHHTEIEAAKEKYEMQHPWSVPKN